MIAKIEQAVILAGGKGKRLRPLTEKIPKPLVKINGIPFCDYLLNSLVKVGISKILFLIGYKGNFNFSSSNRISANCLGELILNSLPAIW